MTIVNEILEITKEKTRDELINLIEKQAIIINQLRSLDTPELVKDNVCPSCLVKLSQVNSPYRCYHCGKVLIWKNKENKMSNESVSCGWLSPSGEFTPCDPYEHIAIAEKLLGNYAPLADEQLLDAGYVKIWRESFCGHKWMVDWRKFLTDSQKTYLKPIFENRDNDFYSYNRYEFYDELEKR